jgi:hypothetical protein
MLFTNQGIGWIFGPFVHISDSTTSTVFGWLFIIFGALEGFWILLPFVVLLRENRQPIILDRATAHIKGDEDRESHVHVKIETTESNEPEAHYTMTDMTATKNSDSLAKEIISTVL